MPCLLDLWVPEGRSGLDPQVWEGVNPGVFTPADYLCKVSEGYLGTPRRISPAFPLFKPQLIQTELKVVTITVALNAIIIRAICARLFIHKNVI